MMQVTLVGLECCYNADSMWSALMVVPLLELLRPHGHLAYLRQLFAHT